MDEAITAGLLGHLAAGNIVGAATRVWRNGVLVHSADLGLRDPDRRLPVEPGTIYRIASLSKPITAVASLILMEAGRFALTDPITTIAPEFAQMQVLRSPSGPLDETDPAIRPITFEDLLTHRSGLTYGDFQTGPIAGAYRRALGGDLDSHVAPDDWIAGLARLPLIAQPGAAFNYSASIDLLGLLLARMEGVSLGEVLRRTIFDPLGMKDTGFLAPAARRAANCGFDGTGKSISLAAPPGGAALAERPADMAFESGGQGLWSTADDYLKFARLFVGGGAVDGVRLLSPQTMVLMMTNHLDEAQRASGSMFGMPIFASHGFGLGLAVVMDPDGAAVTRCKGGIGTVGWPGAYGGWWQADPTNGAVMVFLTHNMMELEQLMMGVGLGVYVAISDFHALASERLEQGPTSVKQ